MGLKTLLSDLAGGMSEYPNHLQDRSGFTSTDFNNKSISKGLHLDDAFNAPFVKPVTWQINDPNAEPTYNDGITKRNQWEINNLDGTFRGGASLSGNRRLIDSKRIGNLFLSSRGIEFIARQTGLQLMNPKISAPQEGGLFDSSPANQRTFSPANTLAQVALGGMALTHTKREGLVPFNERGYNPYNTSADGNSSIRETDTRKNRLLYLYENKISDGPVQTHAAGPSRGEVGTPLGDFIKDVGSAAENIGDLIGNTLNIIGGKGEELYSYANGPNSLLGIGRTFIGRYTDTGKVRQAFDQARRYHGRKPFNFQSYKDPKPLGSLHTWNWNQSRVNKYGTGDPGMRRRELLPPMAKDGTLNYSYYIRDKVDVVNAVDIFRVKNNDFPHLKDERIVNDMVPFYFESINTDDPSQSDVLYFRAFLEDVGDSYKASYNKFNYNGRAEDFYTYKSFDRDLSLSFKIAAQTRHEMMPLYRKLNYLVSHTAPEYHSQSGRIMTPFMKLTVGDWFSSIPGVLQSVSLKWNKDYPWEIKADDVKDSDMLILPHVLDVSVKFQPIHSFLPEKSHRSSFILPDIDSRASKFFNHLQKWAAIPIAGVTDNRDKPLPENYTTENAVIEALRPGWKKLNERYGVTRTEIIHEDQGIELKAAEVNKLPTTSNLSLPPMEPNLFAFPGGIPAPLENTTFPLDPYQDTYEEEIQANVEPDWSQASGFIFPDLFSINTSY